MFWPQRTSPCREHEPLSRQLSVLSTLHVQSRWRSSSTTRATLHMRRCRHYLQPVCRLYNDVHGPQATQNAILGGVPFVPPAHGSGILSGAFRKSMITQTTLTEPAPAESVAITTPSQPPVRTTLKAKVSDLLLLSCRVASCPRKQALHQYVEKQQCSALQHTIALPDSGQSALLCL